METLEGIVDEIGVEEAEKQLYVSFFIGKNDIKRDRLNDIKRYWLNKRQ